MSSTSFSYGWKYDVFLSFRGSDTRLGFISHLYEALRGKGIHTFWDDKELPRGEEIAPSLLKAIEESRIFIPVFSKNYASSLFCLDELVHILACSKEKGRLVLPVFYDVDPSHVRHQRGSYEEALNSHKERFNDDHKKLQKLQKWSIALTRAANLSGYHHFKHGNENEYDFIGKIVKEVSHKINRTLLHVVDHPVGLESRMQKVNSLLNIESGGVHMVGIHGIGGVGKSTVTRAIYNLIADQFEGLCFLDNVRETSIKQGLVHLQETLLSKTIGEKGIKLGSVNEGIPIIKHRLHQKKVLLVLDDVDDLNQLQATAGGTNWFGSGSRVIITTRDRHLLTHHGVESMYEVDGLNEKEALELLGWSAFESDKVDLSCVDILNRVVTYASGLPLALEVIGSNLKGERKDVWKSALGQYQRNPNKKIQDILKVSFDSLEKYEQKIFLDIACCLKGNALTYVKEILFSHHDLCPEYGIRVLIGKSLIKIDRFDRVTMHDLIEDMGKDIVCLESQEPGNRSRLWCPKDIVDVLQENKGTNRIQMITLNCFTNEVEEWDAMGFKEMKNLKTLIIRGRCFTEGPKHLPNSLRVLEWWGYPSPSLPNDFHRKNLVILGLPNSCSTYLNLFKSEMKYVNMRVLNFGFCRHLTETPDVSGVPNLQELSFKCCDNLIKIHESVGFLENLKILDADGCSKLTSFPPIELTALEELKLSYCDSLDCFPEILGKMENVTSLNIRDTPIKEVPSSIQNLTRLERIKLTNGGIIQLPSSILVMKELRCFEVDNCELLMSKENEGEEQMRSNTNDFLEFSLSNISYEFLERGRPLFAIVKKLHLELYDYTTLPECIKEFESLTEFSLECCENLKEITVIPPNLETFSVKDCPSFENLDFTLLPTWNKECCRLRKLLLQECEDLKNVKGIPLSIEVLVVEDCYSLKDLDLTLPPEGTQECRILSTLTLGCCFDLEEIKGIPSDIRKFQALNCVSLTSECAIMLLNKELHEANGYKEFILPGPSIPEWFEADGYKEFVWPETSIPQWFEHCIDGSSSFSFRFCNKFPAICLCVVAGPASDVSSLEPPLVEVTLRFIINGVEHTFIISDRVYIPIYEDFLWIIDHIEEQFNGCEFLENEWNHVECTATSESDKLSIKQIGIHGLKPLHCSRKRKRQGWLSASGDEGSSDIDW